MQDREAADAGVEDGDRQLSAGRASRAGWWHGGRPASGRCTRCASELHLAHRLLDLARGSRRRAPCPRRTGSPSSPPPRRPSPARPAGSAPRTPPCPGRARRAARRRRGEGQWASPIRRYMATSSIRSWTRSSAAAAHGSRRACDDSAQPCESRRRQPCEMRAHVRHRRAPRSGRLAPAERGTRMAAALRHRGPDGEAVRRIGPPTLAHTRLAIIDVAGGDQPLDSEDGSITRSSTARSTTTSSCAPSSRRRATVRHPLRLRGRGARLRGARRRLRARLNGIFAFALWDERARRLVAARDPLGVKPLYWRTDGRRLAVASEVGALLAAGLVEPRVDRVALDHYLACRFVPAPRTLFEGISSSRRPPS